MVEGAAGSSSADHAVELISQRLRLRAFRLDDAETIYEAVRESIPQLSQWLSWCRGDYTINDTIQFLAGRGEAYQQQGEYGFAILERAGGRFVGATGINQLEKATLRANLGYWLRASALGRGYATESTRVLAQWAFAELGLERIEIVAAAGNIASQRVADRVGATRECVARGRLRVHDVQHDAVVFSLVRADLPKLAPS